LVSINIYSFLLLFFFSMVSYRPLGLRFPIFPLPMLEVLLYFWLSVPTSSPILLLEICILGCFGFGCTIPSSLLEAGSINPISTEFLRLPAVAGERFSSETTLPSLPVSGNRSYNPPALTARFNAGGYLGFSEGSRLRRGGFILAEDGSIMVSVSP
jgi:hypothetical protein